MRSVKVLGFASKHKNGDWRAKAQVLLDCRTADNLVKSETGVKLRRLRREKHARYHLWKDARGPGDGAGFDSILGECRLGEGMGQSTSIGLFYMVLQTSSPANFLNRRSVIM